MKSLVRIRRLEEVKKPHAGYPYGNAMAFSADLRDHLENGIESVSKTAAMAGTSKKTVAALKAYEAAARKLLPMLGALEDAISDIEDADDE